MSGTDNFLLHVWIFAGFTLHSAQHNALYLHPRATSCSQRRTYGEARGEVEVCVLLPSAVRALVPCPPEHSLCVLRCSTCLARASTMAFRNHPGKRAITCNMCGQQFFPASLKFHQKACAKKQAALLVPCGYCDAEYTRAELNHHMLNCRMRPHDAPAPATHHVHKGRRVGSRSSAAPSFAGQQGAAPGGPMVAQMAGPDGRMPCAICGRKFNVDRLSKHQGICRKITAHSKKRGTFNTVKHRITEEAKAVSGGGGRPLKKSGGRSKPQRPRARTSLRERMVAEGQTRGAASDGPRFQETMAPARPAPRNAVAAAPASALQQRTTRPTRGAKRASHGNGGGTQSASNSKWKQQSNALREAMKRNRQFKKEVDNGAGFGTGEAFTPTMPSADQHRGLTPCPHCGRTFNAKAAARHVPRCANIINKPKPPPTMISPVRTQRTVHHQRREMESAWNNSIHRGGARTSHGAREAVPLNPYVGRMVGRTDRVAKAVRALSGQSRNTNARVARVPRRSATATGRRGGQFSSTSVSRIGGGSRARAPAARSSFGGGRTGFIGGGSGIGAGGLRATQASSRDNPLVTSSYQTAPHERRLAPGESVTQRRRAGAVRMTQATSADNPLATSTYQVMDHERPLDPRLSVTRQARPGAIRMTQATSSNNPLATSAYQTGPHGDSNRVSRRR